MSLSYIKFLFSFACFSRVPFSFFSIFLSPPQIAVVSLLSSILSHHHPAHAPFSFSPPGSCDHYTSVVRGWWCSVKPEGFKVQVAILSLFLVSALSLAGIVINKKSLSSFFLFWHNPSFFFFSPSAPPLPSFSCSLILSPFLCFHCISMFLFFSPPHFLCVSVSLSLSLSDVFPLLSGGMKNFLKFYQRSSAFSPNTLHAGYWRLQHGPLLCATVLCELYQGIKHKLQTLHSTLSQLGTLHEELCQLTYSS